MIEIRDLSFVYGSEHGSEQINALDHINLHIGLGEFVSLIGPSGCGKSTMLRLAADLLAPTSGSLLIDGNAPRMARLARTIGMVFQDAALLEWRRIIDNVALPLELERTPGKDRLRRARELLDMVGLAGFENAYPQHLSGGMRQRAAIARAMIINPKVLFMDEPFGALDQITRDRLNLELLDIVERHRMTILFVTHSIREAVLLSDRVVVMTPRPGRIREVLDVPLPRPRRLAHREDQAFRALVARGTDSLEEGFTDYGC